MTVGAQENVGPIGTAAGGATPVPQVLRRRPLSQFPTNRLSRVAFILLLIALAILFVYPFVWLISASFKTKSEVFDNALIPHTWNWNYDDVFEIAPVARWFWNSVWISSLGALLVTFSSALVAFAFAYFRFPLRNVLFGLVLATMMLPGQVTMIPVYLLWNEIGKFTMEHAWLPHIGTNTQYPLWVPNLFGSAFYIFLQRQFFMGIPRDLFEAARMDGDSYLTMFWRIAVPLAKPALIVTFIFEIQAKWFDLMTPLIYLRDAAMFTMPLGLKSILDQFGLGGGGQADYQIIIAATVIAVVPMVVLFAAFQKYFIEGIATQGRKG